MPKKIPGHIVFQTKMTRTMHAELKYIARHVGLQREDGTPNLSATIRHLLTKEAKAIREAKRQEKQATQDE